MPKFSRWSAALLFGLLTLFLNTLAHQYPDAVERWYSRGFFLLVRQGIDRTTGRLPVPGFWLFWIGVIVLWISIYRHRPRAVVWPAALRYWLTRLLGFAGLILGLFFWLWGFNYARVPLTVQLNLQLAPLDSTLLWRDLYAETQTLDSLRHRLAGTDTTALEGRRYWPKRAEDTVRAAVEHWLTMEGFPAPGRVRGRLLHPRGLLFGFGASGLYWPFAGEGNVESGQHPLRHLPTMAHEMSHGFGFCDEGVCNFIAYVAGRDHPNAYIAYCARLDYWTGLVRACGRNDGERFRAFLTQIPPGILADEAAIRREQEKYGELFPDLRYTVYDNYLKSQGVAAGMGSYGEVLVWVQAWERRAGVR